MVEHFLEDVLEKTRYSIKSESDDIEGNSRRRKKQQDSKKDPLAEMFEACILYISINPCIYNIRDLEDTLNHELFYLHHTSCMELGLKIDDSPDFVSWVKLNVVFRNNSIVTTVLLMSHYFFLSKLCIQFVIVTYRFDMVLLLDQKICSFKNLFYCHQKVINNSP